MMRGPILLHFFVTYRCNARCSFCDIWRNSTGSENSDPLPLYQAKNIVTDAKRLGVKFVDLTGGEPLLYPQLVALLEHAKNMSLYTSVTTNCILYPRYAERLKGLVDFLHLSVDSDHPEEHDRIRGVKSFHRFRESLEIARELGERPDLLFTVNGDNIGALEGLSRLAYQEKLVLIVNPEFSYFGNNGFKPTHLQYLRDYGKRPYVYTNHAFLTLIQRGGNLPSRPRCRAMTSTVAVSPRGELLLPCFHHQVKKVEINGDLYEAYHSKEVGEFRQKEGSLPFCEGCTINCYFDPSFAYGFDRYFVQSLASKAKYVFDKFIRPY